MTIALILLKKSYHSHVQHQLKEEKKPNRHKKSQFIRYESRSKGLIMFRSCYKHVLSLNRLFLNWFDTNYPCT